MILFNDIVVPNNEFPSLSVETPNEVLEKLAVPKVGMSYQSLEEAKSYYLEYGKQNGFSARVRSTQKRSRDRNDDEVTVCDMVCAREGKRDKVEDNSESKVKRRSTSTIRCECKARMRVVKQDDKSWMVKYFDDTHSHKMVTPNKRVKLRTVKIMPKAAKILVEMFDDLNLPIGRIPALLGGEAMGPFRLGLAMLEEMASVQQSSQSTSDGDQAQKENSLIGPLSGSVLTSG
ncbi:hypothetical protein IFM89_020095 [Coptis chinensis]|uniref:FAR1 domain-containing protein n=1 Tax=Coptis chinensis TaxID=261450 RepID=A0A835HD11_9MAGN|nr:hypothetical protein IFM89_020095 [Coptis chinensis]